MFVFFKLKSVVKLLSLLYVRFFVGVHIEVLNLLLDQREFSDVYILHTFSSIYLLFGAFSNVGLDSLPETIVVDVVNRNQTCFFDTEWFVLYHD